MWKVFVVMLLSVAAFGQANLQDCKTVAAGVDKVGRQKVQIDLARQTAGTLLQLSTDAGQCINAHSTELSAKEIEQLDWLVYRLDAEVMSRMWDFLDRHHLANRFNNEDARGLR